MRRVKFAEGTGIVKISRGRGDVHHQGQYLGRVTRTANGLWRDPACPHMAFRSPAEAAESMVEELV